MNGRDFLAILCAIFIILAIVINPVFLWLAAIFLVLLLGAYFNKGE